MYKILIATNSNILADQLVTDLGSFHDIHICRTGTDALSVLNAIRPEILIVDLILPHMDGLTLLNKSTYRPPVILALTPYLSPNIENIARSTGIGCLMLLPVSIGTVQSNLDSLIKEKLQKEIPSQDT